MMRGRHGHCLHGHCLPPSPLSCSLAPLALSRPCSRTHHPLTARRRTGVTPSHWSVTGSGSLSATLRPSRTRARVRSPSLTLPLSCSRRLALPPSLAPRSSLACPLATHLSSYVAISLGPSGLARLVSVPRSSIIAARSPAARLRRLSPSRTIFPVSLSRSRLALPPSLQLSLSPFLSSNHRDRSLSLALSRFRLRLSRFRSPLIGSDRRIPKTRPRHFISTTRHVILLTGHTRSARGLHGPYTGPTPLYRT